MMLFSNLPGTLWNIPVRTRSGSEDSSLKDKGHATRQSPALFKALFLGLNFFERKNFMERQFTATCYVLHEDKLLLIFHKKHKKWLPPGGHIEPNEIPHEAALREVKEETGLDVELIAQENVWIEERFNSKSIPRPYLCLLEEIPAHKDTPPHQHIDFIYVSRMKEGSKLQEVDEVDGALWFSQEEIKMLQADVDIFLDTQEVACHILDKVGLLQPL